MDQEVVVRRAHAEVAQLVGNLLRQRTVGGTRNDREEVHGARLVAVMRHVASLGVGWRERLIEEGRQDQRGGLGRQRLRPGAGIRPIRVLFPARGSQFVSVSIRACAGENGRRGGECGGCGVCQVVVHASPLVVDFGLGLGLSEFGVTVSDR